MSMSDPVADMLTRIRNAQMVDKVNVEVPSSKLKVAIAQVLKDEGYIESFRIADREGKATLVIELKYYAGRPVIERIERVMAEKNKFVDEEEKESRGEDPKTRHLGSTKTTWVNFMKVKSWSSILLSTLRRTFETRFAA